VAVAVAIVAVAAAMLDDLSLELMDSVTSFSPLIFYLRDFVVMPHHQNSIEKAKRKCVWEREREREARKGREMFI